MRAAPGVEFPAVEEAALLALLRARSGVTALAFAEAPTPLGQGGEARVDAFRLAHAPPALSGPLVLRRLTRDADARQVELERAVHDALVAQGFPAPRALFADSDPSELGAPYLISERLRGAAPLAEVRRPDQLLRHPGRLPRLLADALFRVPRQLAETQVRLHALDVAAFRAAVDAAGVEVETLRFPARLGALARRIEHARLDGLEAGLEWLRCYAPEPEREVVCHGDLVFTNLCVDRGRVTGVFDWSTVGVGDPAYDVAGTLIRLESRIPGVPAALRPVFRLAQHRLARGYLRGYRRELRVDRARLRYYDAFWTLWELSWSSAHLRAGARPTAVIEGRWLDPGTIDFGVERFRAATGLELAPLRVPDASA